MRKHHTPSKKFVLSLLFLTAVFGLSVQFAAARILSLQPLANLSIPHTHLTYLPNPLEFIPILSAVLGAQTIEGADIINYVNIERGKKGAKPLVLNPTLTQAAQLRADVILKHQNIAVQLFAVPATKENYLGYNPQDVKHYGKLLTDIGGKLSFTRFFIEKGWGNQTYYKGWEVLLIRQKDIISEIFTRMKDEKPLGEDERKLTQEYNTNWQ